MSSDEEKEDQISEYFLKSFEEKSPLDYDILDSMPIKVKQGFHRYQKLIFRVSVSINQSGVYPGLKWY